MAWYTTGTIAVSGTTVTGTGTNWLDNKQSIGAGQALLIPCSGTVKMYEIASVTSATKLTLKTSPGTIAAGQAYAILSFYTDSVPDFARRLAAQLSYYQSQMDGWQQIMTGTGDVTLTAPDGTSVTISSLSKLTADTKNTLKLPTANSTADINTITTPGVYSIPSTVSNLPVAANGILVCLAIASGAAVTQEFTSVSTGSATINRKWTRSGTVSGGVASWQSWVSCTLLPSSEAGSADLNMYTTPGSYSGGTLTNAPSVMGNATAIVLVTANGAGSIVTQNAIFTSSNRAFVRTFAGGSWTAWAEVYTTNSKPSISDLGQVARSNLNTELSNNLFAAGSRAANTQGAGVYTFNNTPVGYATQFGTMIQVNNRSDTSGAAANGIWQHYLALGTNGEIIYAYNINATYSARKLYTTGNTTTNSSGALVPASPVVRIVNNRDDCSRADVLGVNNTEYSWITVRGLCNEESRGCSVSRTDVGTYLVKGAVGLAKDLWTVMDCGNGQGRIIALAEAEETADGVVVRCFKQKYSLSDEGDLTVVRGALIDIPDETWIDVRLEMPADSEYSLRQQDVANQMQN